MSATITVKFVVPLTARPGDYAMLYSNNGDGAIDFAAPLTSERIDLFPNGAGNYGFGLAPFGEFPWGMALSVDTQGFGLLPFGYLPWGCGGVLIERTVTVEECGDWLLAFKTFDALGNENVGTPGQAAANVHVAPPAPLGLKKISYNKVTGDLTLAVVDPTSQARFLLPSHIGDIASNSNFPGRINPDAGGTTFVGAGATLSGRTN
jgi:hypothetical protein